MVERVPLIGVLMLDTAFRRWPRDIGQCEGLPFAVRHRRIPNATVASVVRRQPLDRATRDAFIAAGQVLVGEGATLLTTSCGFLYREQSALAGALPVPVVSSALVALPSLQAEHGGRGAPGILTFDAQALGPIAVSDGAGNEVACPVEGLAADSHFRAVVEGRCRQPDPARLRADALEAARRLAAHAPSAVVLECTNLAPWRDTLQAVLGVPVIDLIDVIVGALPGVAT